jgi:hypothetical protein
MINTYYYLSLENYVLDRWWNHRLYPVGNYLTGHKRFYSRPWMYLILKHGGGSLVHYRTWVLSGQCDVWFESIESIESID